LNFVVIGAGPTGVELAGALSEISRSTLARDFRNINPASARVILLEGGDRVLPTFPESLSRRAQLQLERLGVEVRCGARASAVDKEGVMLEGGARIPARTVLWAAGVQASPLARSLGVPLDRAGRVLVEPDLTLRDHPEVYVIGDMAAVHVEGGQVPGLAPAALQAGRCAARNIRRTLAGEPRQPFRYVDKGTLATIGRSKAVGHFRGRWLMSGFFAWVLWWAVHIFFLIGFRNRVAVMFGWIWNYLTFQRGARIITSSPLPEDSSQLAIQPGSVAPAAQGAGSAPPTQTGPAAAALSDTV
jgi:NADH dehydrogenase